MTTQTRKHRDIFRKNCVHFYDKNKIGKTLEYLYDTIVYSENSVIKRYRHGSHCPYFLCIRQSVITVIINPEINVIKRFQCNSNMPHTQRTELRNCDVHVTKTMERSNKSEKLGRQVSESSNELTRATRATHRQHANIVNWSTSEICEKVQTETNLSGGGVQIQIPNR